MTPAYIMAQMWSIILPMLKTILRDSIFRPKGRTGMNIAIHASKIQNTGRIVPNKYYPNNIAFALTTGFPKICQCQKVSECQIFRARKWWLVGDINANWRLKVQSHLHFASNPLIPQMCRLHSHILHRI